MPVIDRILGKGSIPHNKFMVLNQNGGPVAVLSGSTNWTSTGLCTQTNNALVIESAEVAKRYIAYWNSLKADVAAAGGEQKKLQSPALRNSDHKNNDDSISKPIDLGGGVTVEVMFSPNTDHVLRTPPTEKPNDMSRVFELIDGAKEAVLFLAFDPGNNSILDAAGRALAKNADLFVRGALTSSPRASNFSAALHQGGETDQHERPAGVAVVGEPGKPKKKGAKPADKTAAPIDYRAIPAGSVTANDAFGAWEAELAKFGFAIIHNKIVVLDPFSDNCTVITGSHNLGYRASHNNDENMVIVRGHRGLAEAYACHVLDIYDHYAWRYWLKTHPEIFGKPLEPDDTWQERYIVGPDEKSPELRFWLSAAARAARPRRRRMRNRKAPPAPRPSQPRRARLKRNPNRRPNPRPKPWPSARPPRPRPRPTRRNAKPKSQPARRRRKNPRGRRRRKRAPPRKRSAAERGRPPLKNPGLSTGVQVGTREPEWDSIKIYPDATSGSLLIGA